MATPLRIESFDEKRMELTEHLGELREILEQNELHLKPAVKPFEAVHPPVVTVGADDKRPFNGNPMTIISSPGFSWSPVRKRKGPFIGRSG